MSPMTMRQQLLNTGLFSETDTRALIREHVRDESEFGPLIKVGYTIRLTFNPFGDLVDVTASRFDPAMRQVIDDNLKAMAGRRSSP